MSGVSSAKMPEHVPKVASKWNGMPMRAEDHDRAHHRTDSREGSTRTSSTRSRSADPGHHRNHGRPSLGFTTSSDHARQARPRSGKGAHLDEVDSAAGRGSSSKSASQPQPDTISVRTQSLRSLSGTSLPQIPSFFSNDIPQPPGVPQIYGAHAASSASTQASIEGRGGPDYFESGETAVEDLPAHALSPSPTPLEHSPVTPFSDPVSVQLSHSIPKTEDPLLLSIADMKLSGVVLRSSGPDVLGLPTATQKVSSESVRPFLAREARPLQLPEEGERSQRTKSILRNGIKYQVFAPTLKLQQDLEKRPDSSSARLGLRASMIRRADTVPWEWGESKNAPADNRAASPKHVLPKGLGIFGKS